MTDRIRTLTVILDRDYRDDDAEHIVNAIFMIKGVLSVKLGNPVSIKDHEARSAVQHDIREKIVKLWESLASDNSDKPG